MNVVTGIPPEWLRLSCRAFFNRVFAAPSDPNSARAASFLARL